MADREISTLPAAEALTDDALFVGNFSGAAQKFSGEQLKEYVSLDVVSAEAQTLPEGGDATAQYSPQTRKLILGIPRGDEGYGIVTSVSVEGETDAWWTSFGEIGSGAYFGDTEDVRNGCRIGDLFLVTGTATDTGNAHTITYRSTTESGILMGTCIAHTVARSGEVTAAELATKMDKANPTGTGSFSLNRKANTTVGNNSFAEGYNTTASGSNSHAEGSNTTANGGSSHAEGDGTIARAVQHAQGKYNIDSPAGEYAHILGNGTGGNNRSNAHTVKWNGEAWFAGDVYVGSTGGKNKDDGSKRLAREDELPTTEQWTFTLEDGTTVTKAVCVE